MKWSISPKKTLNLRVQLGSFVAGRSWARWWRILGWWALVEMVNYGENRQENRKKPEKTWRTLGQVGKTMGKPPFWQRNTWYLCIFCRNLFLIHYCQGTNHGKTKTPGAHQARIPLIFFNWIALKTHWAHFWLKKWEPSQHQHLQLLISQILFGVYRTGLLIKQGWCTENIQKNQVSRVDFYLGGVGFAFAR